METLAKVVEWASIVFVLGICSTGVIFIVSAVRNYIRDRKRFEDVRRVARDVRSGKAGI